MTQDWGVGTYSFRAYLGYWSTFHYTVPPSYVTRSASPPTAFFFSFILVLSFLLFTNDLELIKSLSITQDKSIRGGQTCDLERVKAPLRGEVLGIQRQREWDKTTLFLLYSGF